MRLLQRLMLVCSIGLFATGAQAALTTGKMAPDFTATDALSQQEFSLSDFKGKTVVLEWVNYGCPFVKKHYSAGNMQMLQENAGKDGVVWIAINSGAQGKQGYLASSDVAAAVAKSGAKHPHYVVDASGMIGKAYGAKTTPHMFIINSEGRLVYQGAIDSNSSADSADIEDATNYVSQALAELKANKPVSVGTTQPYGCSVKYAN